VCAGGASVDGVGWVAAMMAGVLVAVGCRRGGGV
jgi:hypothetical protein